MRLLIYDSFFTPSRVFESVTCSSELLSCNSCFGCWVKTPGVCVKRDMYTIIATKLSRCNELHIISKCFWGSYSPAVKNVLDRCIGYLHPSFDIVDGETRYKKRYPNTFTMTVNFYGNLTKAEIKTANAVVEENATSFRARKCTVNFFKFEHEANEGYTNENTINQW